MVIGAWANFFFYLARSTLISLFETFRWNKVQRARLVCNTAPREDSVSLFDKPSPSLSRKAGAHKRNVRNFKATPGVCLNLHTLMQDLFPELTWYLHVSSQLRLLPQSAPLLDICLFVVYKSRPDLTSFYSFPIVYNIFTESSLTFVV